jgi:hypothetical protein
MADTPDTSQDQSQSKVRAVVSDPKFQSLPFPERVKVMQRLDPRFAALPSAEQIKTVQRLNPDFVKQSKLSPFAMGTMGEGKDVPIEPSYWGITKWIMKETGAGMWDAARGTGQLLMTMLGAPDPAHPETARDPAKNVWRLTGGAILEQLEKLKEVPGAIHDLYKNPYGAAAVAEQLPRAVGQYAGAELGGKLVGAVTKLPEVAAKIEEKGIKEAAQEYVAGTGPSAAEELVTKTKKGREEAEASAAEATAKQQKLHEKKVARIERANQQKLKEHAEATKRVEEVNKAEAEKVGKRAELAGKVKQESVGLGQQLHSFYSKAKARGKALYAPVDAATEGMSVPASELADDVVHAEDNILKGSEENIKQFRDILQKGEREEGPQEDTEDPRGYSYNLSKDMGGGEPITFQNLQGYYNELGKKLYGPGSNELLGDVRSALQYVRKQIGKRMFDMAKKAGVEDELNAAMDFHSQLMGTFNDMSPIKTARNIGQRAGSPVARAIRAQDPQYIRDPFLNPAYGERALNLLKAYESDPGLGTSATALVKSIEGIQNDFKMMNELPKKAKVEPPPEAPKLMETPEAPPPVEPKYADDFSTPPTLEELAKELKERKKIRVSQKSRSFTEMNKWDAIALGYGVKEFVSGEWPKAWAYIIGHYGAGQLMKLPWVYTKLTDVTADDIAILNKIYDGNPLGKAQAQAAMTQVLKQGGRLKPSVIANVSKFLTKPQVQSIIQTTAKAGVTSGIERGRETEEFKQRQSHEELMKGLDELQRDLGVNP